MGLVHLCANRFRGKGIEYDDLYGAGCLGLIKAAKAFDAGRGVRFSTYAVPVILGEIRRLFRDGGTVKVSRSLKELSLRLTRERERFLLRESREPTVSELAELTGEEPELIAEALEAALPPVSLTSDAEGSDNSETDLPTPSPEAEITDRLGLHQALSALPPEDRRLIFLRYFQGKTQSVTAAALGMTQVQVSRREKKLLAELRALMTE
ncbi:RNA polymerase sporulation-specific sigma factor [Ruminococcaceae bacterium FB2012]|nr:RNA polymerase sporulation-specific sigma factor [Ruminococcaceae bacterium FB2012]